MEGDGRTSWWRSFAPVLLVFKGLGVGWGEFCVGIGVGGAAGDVVDDLFARDAVDNDGLILVEILGSDLFDAVGGDGLVAGKVFAEVAGVSGVLVVAVEGVGYAAEAAEALEAGDGSGEFNGTG